MLFNCLLTNVRALPPQIPPNSGHAVVALGEGTQQVLGGVLEKKEGERERREEREERREKGGERDERKTRE